MIATELYHSFRVGTFHCVSASDGYFQYSIPLMFGHAPADEVEHALREHGADPEHIISPYACLFVDTGRHRVMIDVGAGAMAPTTGLLRQSLRAASIDPESIDTVIITHLHPDHVGGSTEPDGSLTFPNATYYVTRPEWDFWWSSHAFEQAKLPERLFTFLRHQAKPIASAMELVTGDEEIVAGIRLVPAEGHTPGHVCVAITSEGSDLLHIADTACHPLHLEVPRWSVGPDVSPEDAYSTKRRIFDQAAHDEALVFTHHFPPPPNLGRVIRHADGWKWLPELPLWR
jgi:glyoxylase-like metal-dependent hydrolase (beta-lactamase superfamily II)